MRATWIVLISASFVAGSVACKDKGDDSKPSNRRRSSKPLPAERTHTVKPKPRPTRGTPRQRVADKLVHCLFSLDAGSKLAGTSPTDKDCFAPDSTYRLSDTVPEVAAVGPKAAISVEKRLSWRAFPDGRRTLLLNLVKGREAVMVWHASGTHLATEGDVLNIPPNQAKVGFVSATYIAYNGEEQITERTQFVDHLTLLGQLGVEVSHQSASLAPTSRPVTALAAGYGSEAKNLQKARALLRDIREHDPRGLGAYYTDDAVLWTAWQPSTAVGRPAVEKSWEQMFAWSSDVKGTPVRTWAAEDYVVMRVWREGSNTDTQLRVPSDGKPVPTGKPYKLQELHVLQFDKELVKQHWIFANRQSWAVQVGLLNALPATSTK